jgi:DNA-binding beta-propeller fold protein YncE
MNRRLITKLFLTKLLLTPFFLTPFFLTLFFLTMGLLTCGAQEVCHPRLGTSVSSPDKGITLTLSSRHQNYNARERATLDKDVLSPKSVNIHPSGTKLYVNSLEGMRTVVYDAKTGKKLKVINHSFDGTETNLWAPWSGYYKFEHYSKNLKRFGGKPVESAFSHGGRYLWIPYYRRSFDLNAQDPSAIAVIDTRSDRIVRLMETGILPKMVEVSPDNSYVAVAHWGDNTVGIIDIRGNDPTKWHHRAPAVVDKRLSWNFSLTQSVNRDSGSGNALRGTVFTPDGKYILVGCMGGNGGIAVIETAKGRYLGKLTGMMSNLRHIIISKGYLYLSINGAGYVQRVPLSAITEAIAKFSPQKKSVAVSGWVNCKTGAGARTISASPSGRYIYVACNAASSLDVVNASTMKRVASLPLDSYPVGMDVSADGRHIYVTCQGRKGKSPSGNCVDIVKVDIR